MESQVLFFFADFFILLIQLGPYHNTAVVSCKQSDLNDHSLQMRTWVQIMAESFTHTTINFKGYQISLLEYSLIRCVCLGKSFVSLSLPHQILCLYQMTASEWMDGQIDQWMDG